MSCKFTIVLTRKSSRREDSVTNLNLKKNLDLSQTYISFLCCRGSDNPKISKLQIDTSPRTQRKPNTSKNKRLSGGDKMLRLRSRRPRS